MSQSPTAPIPAVDTSPSSGQALVPFRIATRERSEIDYTFNGTITTAQQQVINAVGGSGYLYGMYLRALATATGNAATVAFAEDAPYSAYQLVQCGDPTGPFCDLQGYNLKLANQYDANYANNWLSSSALTFSTAGAVGGGGSFQCMMRVPAGLNRRTLLGILGNQDRSQRYQLRTDIAPSTNIYSTAPTTLPPIELDRINENYSVPPLQGLAGQNEIVPSGYGTVQFHTQSIAETAPIGNSLVNHLIDRIGNTVRYWALVFRVNGSRASAETAMAGATINLRIGDTNYFNEPYWYRKAQMYEHFGFDSDNGVLVYDSLHDFAPHAGNEIGEDWYNTQAISRAQFQIQYPSAIGNTNNSLYIITSDLGLVGRPLAS